MNIERVDGQRRLPLSKPIKINIGHHETRGAAISIFEDPLEITLNGDCRASEAMEDRDPLGLKPMGEIVRLGNTLKKRRENCNNFGHN